MMTKREGGGGRGTQSLRICHLGWQENNALPGLHVGLCVVEQTFRDQKITKGARGVLPVLEVQMFNFQYVHRKTHLFTHSATCDQCSTRKLQQSIAEKH